MELLEKWSEASITSLSFFWMALWAFIFGYILSSIIQVMVSRKEMRDLMGGDDLKSISTGTLFGFISSSCSFAALSTTRALFQKGATFAASMAYMLASTNLVIELGFVIAIFLGWQFVIGEYIGAVLLILIAWLFIYLTNPKSLIKQARENKPDEMNANESDGYKWSRLFTKEIWQKISQKYVMEWQMVWKDVLIGFTVAGIISAFVPDAFFKWLFIGAGTENPDFWSVLQQTLVGPIAAFFTFIGSMGNIPLAAVLYGQGVAFAGVMAFIFSDMVVLPVLRINAKYYGWKMALFILMMLFTCLVMTSLLLHYGFQVFDLLPNPQNWSSPAEQDHFKLNYNFFLNIGFLLISAYLFLIWRNTQSSHHHDHNKTMSWTDIVMNSLTILSGVWLAGGVLVKLLLN